MVLDIEEHARSAVGVGQVRLLPIHKADKWRYRKAASQVLCHNGIAHLPTQLSSSEFENLKI